MLTIALDAEHTRQSGAGIARYALSLASALKAQGNIELIELGGGAIVPRGTFRKRLLTARQDLLWYPLLARRRAASVGAGVYHSPLLRGPLTRGRPAFVVTVHDLVPVRWPGTMPRWHRFYTTTSMRRILDAADRIITPSQDTADDVAALLGVSLDKIRVIRLGVDKVFSRPAAPAPAALQPYILFVGTPEPRKNLAKLVSAMTILRGRGFQERLVIAGSGGWGDDVLRSPFVERAGRVSDVELHSLYSHAACVVIPSLHEGFGLPALEAMASGAPVVAANSGALPETTGNAAVMVNALRPEAIADGIAEALSDRSSLVARGRERAKEFSWENTAALTTAVYREVA